VISLCKAASSFLMARPLWEYGIHLNFLLKVTPSKCPRQLCTGVSGPVYVGKSNSAVFYLIKAPIFLWGWNINDWKWALPTVSHSVLSTHHGRESRQKHPSYQMMDVHQAKQTPRLQQTYLLTQTSFYWIRRKHLEGRPWRVKVLSHFGTFFFCQICKWNITVAIWFQATEATCSDSFHKRGKELMGEGCGGFPSTVSANRNQKWPGKCSCVPWEIVLTKGK
jgi:hypothetical protein